MRARLLLLVLVCSFFLLALKLVINQKAFKLQDLYLGEPIIETPQMGLSISKNQRDPFLRPFYFIPNEVTSKGKFESDCLKINKRLILDENCSVFLKGEWNYLKKNTWIKGEPNFLWFMLLGLGMLFFGWHLGIVGLIFLSIILIFHAYFYIRLGNLQHYVVFPFILTLVFKSDTFFKGINRTNQSTLVLGSLLVLLFFFVFKTHAFERFTKWSYHPDEKTKLQQTKNLLETGQGPSILRHPPLMIKSFALGKKVFKTNDDEFLFRLIQSLYVLVGVLAISIICYRYFGLEGFIFSIKTGLSSILIFVTGNYLKEDAPFFCFSALAYLMITFCDKQKLLFLSLSFLFGWLATISKYTGFLTLLSLLFLWWVHGVSVFRSLLAMIVTGILVVIVFAPELVLEIHSAVEGLKLEVIGKLSATSGYRYPAIDFLFLYSFLGTYVIFENPFFGVISVLATVFLLKNNQLRPFGFILLAHYLIFEINQGKPPQMERYLLPSYIFLILGVSGVASKFSVCRKLLFISILSNLIQLAFLSIPSLTSEFRVSEYLCEQGATKVIHSRHILRTKCNTELLSFKRDTIHLFNSYDFQPESTFYVMTSMHILGFIEPRVDKNNIGFGALTFGLARKFRFKKQIGSRIFQKAYLNNVYYVYKVENTEFSRVLRRVRKFYGV